MEMEPGKEYWSLVEPIWDEVSVYDGPELFLRRFEAAPEAARNLLAAHWLQSEVRNGGFEQFFENSSGMLAPEAEAAFRALGMPETAGIVKRAMQLLLTPFPREQYKRCEQLEGVHHDLWDLLDEKLFELIESELGGFEQAADTYARQSKLQE